MLPPLKSFFDPKYVWRQRMKILRRAAAAERAYGAEHAARHFLDAFDIHERVVALYVAIGDELDTAPLRDELVARGARIALPSVDQKNAPLRFRAYGEGDALADDAAGVPAPLADAPALRPDIIVTPLLAATRTGDRLGYGGGYYDRTLEALRQDGAVVAVGYGFAAQIVDALPVGPLDQRLDWVVTEQGALRC